MDKKGNYPKSIEREYSFLSQLSQFGERSKPISSLGRIVKFARNRFLLLFFFSLFFSFSIGKEDGRKDEIFPIADIFIYREISSLVGGNIKNVSSWKRGNAAKKGDRL